MEEVAIGVESFIQPGWQNEGKIESSAIVKSDGRHTIPGISQDTCMLIFMTTAQKLKPGLIVNMVNIWKTIIRFI